MAPNELHETANALVAPGKGILAADESDGTIKKRFDAIGLESTEEHRRAYREMLFTTPGAEEYISGVILFDETIRQSASDGTPFPELLASKGIIPGIKVDKGAKPLALAEGETITEGLDGLRARLEEYRGLGARFAKWRATYSITDELPSDYCIWTNAHALARYAALCQEAGLVPIVEPEVLQDGTHTIERSYHVTSRVLDAVYTELFDQRVDIVRHAAEAEHGALRLRGVRPRRPRRGRRLDAEVLLQARAGGRAGDRLPVGRPVRRRRDRAPERDERARPAPLGALVLLRPRAAGARAEGVGRQAGERRGRPARLLPPREAELGRAQRELHARDGAGRRGGLTAGSDGDHSQRSRRARHTATSAQRSGRQCKPAPAVARPSESVALQAKQH